MAEQSKLENVFSYSFPGNHLLQISIVKQTSTDAKDYKKQHFCFISLAPGQQTQSGRTFDFKSRVTMKVDMDKIMALGHAVRNYAFGREAVIGKYGIYVDSSKSAFTQGQGTGKSLGLQRGVDQKSQQPVITLFFKVGTANAHAFSMNVANALAFADICEFIGKQCLELEFKRVHMTGQGVSENTELSNPPDEVESAGPFSDLGAGKTSTPGQVADNFTNMFPASSDDIPF